MNGKNQASGVIIFSVETKNFLCVKRSKHVEQYKNLWSIPAGTIKNNETPEECILREIQEELSIDVNVIQQLKKLISIEMLNGGQFHIFLGYVDGEFKPKLDFEHTEYKWSKTLPRPNVNDISLIMKQIQDYYGR